MAKLIYLAAPYSHPDKAIVWARFQQFCRVASVLTRNGHFVSSPLFCDVLLEHGGLPSDWNYWQHYSREMLARLDELWIITLDGWRESVGVIGEIKIAKEFGKPMCLVDAETLLISDWTQ